MLTEEIPFNKYKWLEMIKFLRTTDLFNQEEKQLEDTEDNRDKDHWQYDQGYIEPMM